MGAYYAAFNHDKRELLDPDTCDGNSKQTSVVMGEFANVLTFAMSERWLGDNVCLLTDEGSNLDSEGRSYWARWHADYTDVSKEELGRFKTRYRAGSEA